MSRYYRVVVKNIRESERNESDLLWIFLRFGKIRRINVSRFYLRRDEAEIEFIEREAALNASRNRHLHGMIVEPKWKDMRLDFLNDDCLFLIYSYLSLDDLHNLSKVTERQRNFVEQIPFYRKTRNVDFFKCIRNIDYTVCQILDLLSPPRLEQAVPFQHSLQLEASNENIDVESHLRPRIKDISISCFNFARMTRDDLYFFQYVCPNLNAFKIVHSRWQVLLIESDISAISKKSQTLRLCDPEPFLNNFPAAYLREDIELKITCIKRALRNLENLGNIDSVEGLNNAAELLQNISNITSNITHYYVHRRDTEIQKANLPIAPHFTNNFKYLFESNLGELLDSLEIDFDFFNITEDYMEYISKYENLKKLKMICRPFILESAEFLATMKQIVRYNKIEKLEMDIKWLDRSDDCGTFIAKLRLKIDKILKKEHFKKPLALRIRVFLDVLLWDPSNEYSFVLNGI